jgi:hypothetical protein
MHILFADLVHNRHICNSVPLGIAMVAAYARERIGAEISVAVFKSPDELARVLAEREPDLVCFSSYIWNTELSLAMARRIKAHYPSCITVFGGPHYPLEFSAQETLMLGRPEVDFHIFREGEAAFVGLYTALRSCGFARDQLRSSRALIPGCHYLHDGILIAGPPLSPLANLDEIPSPYLAGLCDKFLEQGHTAIVQTVRGCPFRCSYCQEGDEYFNPVRRYSLERVKAELWYIGRRATASKLYFADSNFGMYAEDIEVAKELALVQQECDWPEFVDCIAGKNDKVRVLKTAATIRGGQFSAAIQSSDATVLQNIRRQNVSIQEIMATATAMELFQTHSFSEIITALPGDSLNAHVKSACDLIDAGIHVVRSHQLIMLPGAEVSSAASRERFGMQTRFRVMHNTVNPYLLFNETFYAPEIDEICVANDTMTFQDYLQCRCFDLTLEIFYNNGIFHELHTLLRQVGIQASSFIRCLHDRIRENPVLAGLYADFLVDTRELWQSRRELEGFLAQPGVLERYHSGELGRNEQLAFKAKALFDCMKDLVCHAYGVARDVIFRAGRLDEVAEYLDELQRFDLLRKDDLMGCDAARYGTFHYDFVALLDSGFRLTPGDSRGDFTLKFCHDDAQVRFLESMRGHLDEGLHGYAFIISSNPKIKEYYRCVSRVEVIN